MVAVTNFEGVLDHNLWLVNHALQLHLQLLHMLRLSPRSRVLEQSTTTTESEL